MKIVYVLNNSGMYGANRSLLSLVDCLLEEHHDCCMLLPEDGAIVTELTKRSIPFEIIGYRPCVWYPGYVGLPFLVNLVRLPAIVKTIRRWNPDIIHSNNSSHDIGMLAAKILGIPHVWHVREIMESNYNTRYIFPRLYKKLRAESDAVICVSEFIRKYHMEHFPNAHMYALYNPFDTQYYDIPRAGFAPDKSLRILLAGAFTEYKRQIDSLEAVRILIEKGIRNIHLTLAGSGSEEYTGMLQNYINKNGLQEYIDIAGFQSDLRPIRKKTDVALCCSVDEALPRVLVEGMIGRMLIIASDSGGNVELVGNDNERGLLYETGNPVSLANQLEYALNNKAACWDRILKAREFADENFEMRSNGKRFMQVYDQLLNSPQRGS